MTSHILIETDKEQQGEYKFTKSISNELEVKNSKFYI